MQAQKLRHESYDKLFVQQKCVFWQKHKLQQKSIKR
jgi:hypothetical protein